MHLPLLALLILPFMAAATSNSEQIPLGDYDITSSTPATKNAPSLADLLTIQNSVSIFYSYARETSLSRSFDHASGPMTLFVPTNVAVMALARKPHQGPKPIDEDINISEQEFDARSRRNVDNWVGAHMVMSEVDLSTENTYHTLLEGFTISATPTAGDSNAPVWSRVHLNGNISISNRFDASNGVLYFIDGALYG